MSTVERWNPFRELESVRNQLNSVFGASPLGNEAREEISQPDWAPPVDVSEDANEFSIAVELPDLKLEDIDVRVDDGVLYIQGKREREAVSEDKKYHRVERYYGRFTRSFVLPDNVDPDSVKANLKNGILRVSLPKSERARPKQIVVESA